MPSRLYLNVDSNDVVETLSMYDGRVVLELKGILKPRKFCCRKMTKRRMWQGFETVLVLIVLLLQYACPLLSNLQRYLHDNSYVVSGEPIKAANIKARGAFHRSISVRHRSIRSMIRR